MNVKKILDYIIRKKPQLTSRFGRALLPKALLNINIDVCNESQKRVLILYCYMMGIDYGYIRHANVLQATQMIHYFISKDYCVDYCLYSDWNSYNTLLKRKYDIIVGQGNIYKEMCRKCNIPIRVCLLSENHPETAKNKYQERLAYFKERHPDISLKGTLLRTDILDVEQFHLSTHGILMNSKYNSKNYTEFDNMYLVNSNAMYDPFFIFNEEEIGLNISDNRKRVLWFGSGGVIHKGLDILVDVIKNMPDIELNCYGIKKEEKKFFKKISGNNTFDRGHINVMSEEFYNEVVLKHNIVVFPSCSEGMATSIATCMAYGIIPVITKETGFDPCDCIFFLKDYKMETIRKTIIELQDRSAEEILELRKKCCIYARKNFSLNHYNDSLKIIMDDILNMNVI